MSDLSPAQLSERLRRLEDERAIVDTMNGTALAMDYGDRDLFLGSFTSDADYAVEVRTRPEYNVRVHGQDEIGAYFDRHTHAPAVWHKNVVTNPSVVVTGDTAKVTSYLIRLGAEEKGSANVAFGRLTDDFVRGDDGKWRLKSRLAEMES
ncbi:nuclear transport factor 2 family protein [Streptomyces sp. NPDC096311]|uniref:nuclear transport factor 2 family protein n=1 Tax=Streptomyces sp. NPDC096311 TaxID=3366083 RepID=UPI00382F9507